MISLPEVDFVFVRQKDCKDKDCRFETVNSLDLWGKGRHVIFALPGAFTPTCTQFQLPSYEASYDSFIGQGKCDGVSCISVNDGFVMNAWKQELGIEKVQLVPDGNGMFTGLMNMLVTKNNLGFGLRSWRYAAVIEDGVVMKIFEEPGKIDDCEDDPYEVSFPENVLMYLDELNNANLQA